MPLIPPDPRPDIARAHHIVLTLYLAQGDEAETMPLPQMLDGLLETISATFAGDPDPECIDTGFANVRVVMGPPKPADTRPRPPGPRSDIAHHIVVTLYPPKPGGAPPPIPLTQLLDEVAGTIGELLACPPGHIVMGFAKADWFMRP